MSLEIQGTVTRRSNGSLTITPHAGAPTKAIEVYEGHLASKDLPQMGDNVTVTIVVTQPVEPPPVVPPIETPIAVSGVLTDIAAGVSEPAAPMTDVVPPGDATPINRRSK